MTDQDPTFRYEFWTKRALEGLEAPSAVEAHDAEGLCCVFRASDGPPDLSRGWIGPWIVAHIPSGAAVWLAAPSLQQGRIFAEHLGDLLGGEFLLTTRDPRDKDTHEKMAAAVVAAKRRMGHVSWLN